MRTISLGETFNKLNSRIKDRINISWSVPHDRTMCAEGEFIADTRGPKVYYRPMKMAVLGLCSLVEVTAVPLPLWWLWSDGIVRGRDFVVGEDGYEWTGRGSEIGDAMILYRWVKRIVSLLRTLHTFLRLKFNRYRPLMTLISTSDPHFLRCLMLRTDQVDNEIVDDDWRN